MDENGSNISGQDEQHLPVLSHEVMAWMPNRPHVILLDCTIGYGGLAARLLSGLGETTRVIGIDQDPVALDAARARLEHFGKRVTLIQGNFSELDTHLRDLGIERVDGVVMDLGVSSPQLDRAERGFSFSLAGPLDMRMSGAGKPSAEDLVNRLPEKQLADLIFQYGEERYARRIARGIVRAREVATLQTTDELVEVIRRAVPPVYRHGRLHCATRTFQALRIVVNQELDALKAALPKAVDCLSPGGRLAVISFHSLEDRIVKHVLREWAAGERPRVSIHTKKPVRASEEECAHNPRARSAKLRVAERLS